MSSTFVNLLFTTVLLTALMGLAILPWMLATSLQRRRKAQRAGFWIKSVIVSLIVAVVAAYYLDRNSDQEVLAWWGRIYMSILQANLSADLFVVIIGVLLWTWPKGAAVAYAAFREGVRQPWFWLLTGAALVLMGITPIVPYFTFGEDYKMVKEICFAFAMMFPAGFGVLASGIFVSDEIEGRTAITLMSKPVSRREFLLGKFVGIGLAALAMTVLLGWFLVWIFIYKAKDEGHAAATEALGQDPEMVIRIVDSWLPRSSTGDLVKGIGYWLYESIGALPGLISGFCKVTVLISIAVSLATRVPMVINLTTCLVVYFLGHLTPVITEVSRIGNYRLIYFVAQVFDTILPSLDLFDVGNAVVRDSPLPPGQYAIYIASTVAYAMMFSTIAMLIGLLLFEDRDLA